VRLEGRRRVSNNVRLPWARNIEATVRTRRARKKEALPEQINGIDCGESVCRMNVVLSEKMANLDENNM
jgi:Ulp1 family protease